MRLGIMFQRVSRLGLYQARRGGTGKRGGRCVPLALPVLGRD
jgi:hypothetical protein